MAATGTAILASGHGKQNLIEGIKNSCNVYFYQVGLRIGLDRFLKTGTRLGFGKRTGVDIPSEIDPNFPEDRSYWTKKKGYAAQEGEVLSMAIGQGPITMTALKLAQIYTALVRPDGRVPAPRFAMDAGPPADTFHLNLEPRNVWFLEAGMRRALGPGGTAALSRLQNWALIGKTGTAQNPPHKAHGWFVGMGGPKDGEPEIAAVMFMEFAEHGALASGYVAEAINFYLNRKYGRPFDGWATPRFRMAKGLPVNWNFSSPIIDPPMPAETIVNAQAPPPDSLRSAVAAVDSTKPLVGQEEGPTPPPDSIIRPAGAARGPVHAPASPDSASRAGSARTRPGNRPRGN